MEDVTKHNLIGRIPFIQTAGSLRFSFGLEDCIRVRSKLLPSQSRCEKLGRGSLFSFLPSR